MQKYILKEGESWNDTNMPDDDRNVKIVYSATPNTYSRHNTNTIGANTWKYVQSWEYADNEVIAKPKELKAIDAQEGGNHYKSMKIQPVEYIMANELGYLEGNVVKYISRHKSKNGAEDIRKAIHYCQLILELQYEEKTTS